MDFCYHCGRQFTDPDNALAIIVIESRTGRLGTARLHGHCCDESSSRYRQTVTWDGATLSNLSAFKSSTVGSPP
jgi:hypothetical protein